MMPPAGSPRTNVYVDGLNLYYGCFKSPDRYQQWRSFKWLNIATLSSLLLPKYEINRIRYFTARVHWSEDDPDQPTRQDAYLRALSTIPNLIVHEGRFSIWAKSRLLADQSSAIPRPIKPLTHARVIQEEEKGSDVNLTSHLLVDAFKNDCDISVVISNDSDLAEPIRLLRSELGREVILVNPRGRIARDLQDLANEYRQIRLSAINASQFPDVVIDANGREIHKPGSWN